MSLVSAKSALRVVVVDNDAAALELVVTDLTLEGHDVVGTCLDGATALDLCRELRPDVAVIDHRMPPGPHGLEVAQRLTAAPGSKVYGSPTAKLAWYADARPAGRVPPSVFWPVPRVESGLVLIARRPPPATSADRTHVFAVIDAAFAQRRKMLRSALAGWAGSAEAAAQILVRAGVAPTARGEELAIGAFAAIAERGTQRSAEVEFEVPARGELLVPIVVR